MQQKIIFLSAFLIYISGLSDLIAQNASPASGGYASGIGGTASYTIGQSVYTANAGTGGVEGQGVQQPFEIFEISDINDKLIFLLYPNPTSQYLNLTIENYPKGNYFYQLFDLLGRNLESKEVSAAQTIITMIHYPSAPYLLVVSQDNKQIKTFKIIKN